MVGKFVAVLLLVCCLALASEALILPHCPHGQTQVGYCGPHTWWRCSVGNCYPVNSGFGVCCKWFSHGGYY
uniref:Secreted protein n=1 Tax=Magallana gigas TaxID=29159 RepID=A0A8W8MWE1_MAGGI